MLFSVMRNLLSIKPVWLLAVAVLLSVLQHCAGNEQKAVSEDLVSVKQQVLSTNAVFRKQVQDLIALAEKNAEPHVLQQNFNALRIIYKKMEWAVEYFLPHSARFINGPAVPEIEFAEKIVIEPEGLQVLEALVYDYDEARKPEVIMNLKRLLGKSGNIDSQFGAITVNRAQVFDALRNEVFRISSLGIAGFDTPVSGRHLSEMPYAIEGVTAALKLLRLADSPVLKEIQRESGRAASVLRNHPDYRSFDYATFLSLNLNRISALMLEFKKEQNIPDVAVTTALRKDAPSFFAKNSFDVDAFVPGGDFEISEAKVALGKQLFNDRRLSRDNVRSCATCHVAEKAFTDGREKSLSLDHNLLPRNTPSLNYAALQHGQFWDMRNEDLEGQSSDVITNKDEMHSDLEDIVRKIQLNKTYSGAFKAIYKTPKVENWQLQNALASYIRSLARFSSPFDDFMRGDKNAISENQKQGFNLFVGKAKCATCHFLPVFNGTVPPSYTKTEQEVLGVAESAAGRYLDPDKGRGKFHETVAFLQHSFKTPTVRNAAITAPYMHNGGYKTLKEVMEFYNKGGGAGAGLEVENQTLPPDQLDLTNEEQEKIIDFIRSLTDR